MVVNPRNGGMLGGFQHRLSHRMIDNQPWRLPDDVCEYLPLGGAMREARLDEVEVYITQRQTMVAPDSGFM